MQVRFSLFLLPALFAGLRTGATQNPTSTYEPTVGQEGKDVVWVPTPQAVVDKMLDMAKVTPKDFVMDLGSGRRPHGDHRGEARRARARHRVQPGHGRALEAQRREGGRRRPRPVHEGRSLRDRLLEGHGHHDVPAARHQPQAAPEDPQAQARHARRLEQLHHGRLAGRPDGRGSARTRAARTPGARRSSGSCRRRSPERTTCPRAK